MDNTKQSKSSPFVTVGPKRILEMKVWQNIIILVTIIMGIITLYLLFTSGDTEGGHPSTLPPDPPPGESTSYIISFENYYQENSSIGILSEEVLKHYIITAIAIGVFIILFFSLFMVFYSSNPTKIENGWKMIHMVFGFFTGVLTGFIR